jgi:hypothetical protein
MSCLVYNVVCHAWCTMSYVMPGLQCRMSCLVYNVVCHAWFTMSYVMVGLQCRMSWSYLLLLLSEFRKEVIVRFVDIGGIVDYHCFFSYHNIVQSFQL